MRHCLLRGDPCRCFIFAFQDGAHRFRLLIDGGYHEAIQLHIGEIRFRYFLVLHTKSTT